jgi:CheY-like chemotaxis protein
MKKMNFETVPLASLNLDRIYQRCPVARPTILVVDDEAVIADTLGMILETNGYRVNIAYDGISALKLSRTVPPDLLLTDVSMPGMSGIDLAIEMRQSLPACKALLFSGQASTSDLLGAARLAGHEFTVLAKPLHPTELLRRLSDSLPSRNSADTFAAQIDCDQRESITTLG